MKVKLLLTSIFIMALLLATGGSTKLNSAQASIKIASLWNWTFDKVRFAPIYGGWTGTLSPYLG